MKNNKGFTLAELLVVIAILTLLTIMVFPSISKMWANNEKKKFESYEKMTAEFAEATREHGTVDLCTLGTSTDLEDVKRDCDGYVTETNGVYKAYIHCEKADYSTEGYNSSLSHGPCN